MPDLSEAAIDLLFEADNFSIDGLELTLTNKRPAANELVEAGYAVGSVELCGDPCCCEIDMIRLTDAGVAAMSNYVG